MTPSVLEVIGLPQAELRDCRIKFVPASHPEALEFLCRRDG